MATAPASCDAAPGKDHAALVAWHRTVQALPLFAAVAAGAPVACKISAVDGVLRVGYRFADGTRIEANRDPAIEYVSVALRFAPAKRLDVQPVLAATERALFGASGCGIDWTRPSGAPAASASAIATQFEGASCNCRALVQRSVDGAAISAGLSATC